MGVEPDLVRAAQNGDVFALDELIDALYPLVRRICTHEAGYQHEDATQEAMLAIFRDLHALRTPEAILSWASAVTARTAARFDRNDRRQRGGVHTGEPDTVSSWFDHDAVEVTDVLTRLPDRDHAVLVLRDLQGLSEQETAETLGVPVGTVKSRVSRARKRFREQWSQ